MLKVEPRPWCLGLLVSTTGDKSSPIRHSLPSSKSAQDKGFDLLIKSFSKLTSFHVNLRDHCHANERLTVRSNLFPHSALAMWLVNPHLRKLSNQFICDPLITYQTHALILMHWLHTGASTVSSGSDCTSMQKLHILAMVYHPLRSVLTLVRLCEHFPFRTLLLSPIPDCTMYWLLMQSVRIEPHKPNQCDHRRHYCALSSEGGRQCKGLYFHSLGFRV